MKARKNYKDRTITMRMDYKDLYTLHHGLYATMDEIRSFIELSKNEDTIRYKERELKKTREQFEYVGKMFDWAINDED